MSQPSAALANDSASNKSACRGLPALLRTGASAFALPTSPTTEWPRAVSCRISRLPSTPDAPAMNTFMELLLRLSQVPLRQCRRRDGLLLESTGPPSRTALQIPSQLAAGVGVSWGFIESILARSAAI